MKKLFCILHFTFCIALAASAQQPAGAHLQLKETYHNFGDVARQGGDLVYEFEYTNDGTSPLVILRTQTNCSCTKVVHSKKPLAPGQKEKIKVIYETRKADPGTFNKVIQIHSNSTSGRELITISGNSIER